MSKSKVTSTIDYLSDPRKGITAAILLVLAIVVVAFLWKKIRSLWDGSSLKGSIEDSKIESSTGSTITLTDSQFAQLAERLWTATCEGGDFWSFGTDEDEVYAVLGCLNTQADYAKLSLAWTECVNSKSWWKKHLTWAGMQSRSTLPGILRAELNSSELAHARSILTAQGITPDF